MRALALRHYLRQVPRLPYVPDAYTAATSIVAHRYGFGVDGHSLAPLAQHAQRKQHRGTAAAPCNCAVEKTDCRVGTNSDDTIAGSLGTSSQRLS